MFAKLVIIVMVGWNATTNTSVTSFKVYPLADQNAYDHCMDLATHAKQNISKDLNISPSSVSATCYDVGQPNE
jgi:hypothetical protein